MSWQKILNKITWPFLKGLWKDSMISIRKSIINNIPCLFKRQFLFIHQDSQKLNCGNSWMRIVQLNLIKICKLGKHVVMLLFISSNDIIQRCWAEKVLLLQSQFFTSVCFIIWVKDTGDILSILSFSDGSIVIRGVEFVEIEFVLRSRFPKSQVVGVVSIESRNWSVICHSNYDLATIPISSLSGSIFIFWNTSIKSDFICDILSFNFPWVTLS